MTRTLVMGVVNVTPDSFSDGGLWREPADAIAHGRDLIEQGADLLDIGGESTRPGAVRPPLAEELARVLPVIEALAPSGVPISVDTMRAEVAIQAVGAGASIVNDVSGGLADDDMLPTVAQLGVDYVCQHWRAFSVVDRTDYADVVADVRAELQVRLAAVAAAGIDPAKVILDPGLGFAKRSEHNWAILANLGEFTSLGHRLLIGASRKRFLGDLLGGRPVGERDDASTAVSAWCGSRGVWAVRTHTVRPHRDALEVITRLAAEPIR